MTIFLKMENNCDVCVRACLVRTHARTRVRARVCVRAYQARPHAHITVILHFKKYVYVRVLLTIDCSGNHLRRHDGMQGVEPVLSLASARLAETLVFLIVPDRASDLTAAVEEHAAVGASGVQVAVAAVLPVAVRAVEAVDDSVTSGRAA